MRQQVHCDTVPSRPFSRATCPRNMLVIWLVQVPALHFCSAPDLQNRLTQGTNIDLHQTTQAVFFHSFPDAVASTLSAGNKSSKPVRESWATTPQRIITAASDLLILLFSLKDSLKRISCCCPPVIPCYLMLNLCPRLTARRILPLEVSTLHEEGDLQFAAT